MTREELIHAMMSAFRDGIIGSASEQRQDFKGMAAALDVAVGELLPDPTAMDYGKELDAVERSWDRDHQSLRCAITQNKVRQMVRDAVCIWWTNQRSRYLPKSAEERVTVSILPSDLWAVYLDGKLVCTQMTWALAATYRLGLIQQLKESK